MLVQLERPLVIPTCPLDLLLVEVEPPFDLLAEEVEGQVDPHLLKCVWEEVSVGDAWHCPEGQRAGVALPGFNDVLPSSLLRE